MAKLSFTKIFIALALFFLYAPIAILVIYSFNDSRHVATWSEFSLKWYFELLQDKELIQAAWTSIEVAAFSATLSVAFGTFAAISLARFGMFFGRNLFTTLLTAPFVMPEIITGFSLLLLFTAIEQLTGLFAERNIITIILAHTTFGIAYTTIVVQARLAHFDKSLEEAALDLGASPVKVFFHITLPIISKSIFAGWLLAFTLSLDDLIIASFTSGPGSTTLPMLIYSRIKLGINPGINALATIMILLVVLSMLGLYFSNVRKKES